MLLTLGVHGLALSLYGTERKKHTGGIWRKAASGSAVFNPRQNHGKVMDTKKAKKRLKRFGAFVQTVRVELKRLKWRYRPVFLARLVWYGVLYRKVARATFIRRIRACARCPIYGMIYCPDLKRWVGNRVCRPYQGSALGCGCYMPYKAAYSESVCWADETGAAQAPAMKGKGWDASIR